MNRPICIFGVFLCAWTVLAAGASAQRKTFLKFNPTTLVNELDVSLEQELGTHTSLMVGAGFVYTDYWDNILNQFNLGQYRPAITEHQYLNAKGYVGRAGLRYYVISPYSPDARARGTYFEPVLLYRQIWYPSEDKQIEAKTYHEKGNKRVAGLQLLIGRQYRKNKLYIDKYIGLGIKAKTYHLDHYRLDPDTHVVGNTPESTTTWLPSLHLGIRIAFEL